MTESKMRAALRTIAWNLICDRDENERCEDLELSDDDCCNPCAMRRVAERAL